MRRGSAFLLLLSACEAETLGLDPLADPMPMDCRQLDPSIETGRLPGGARFSPPFAAEVSDGVVYIHRASDETGLSQIVAFDPLRASELTLTEGSVQAYLLDADHGAALWISEDQANGGRFNIFHRNDRGDARRIAESSTWLSPSFDEGFLGREISLVDRTSAAWRSSEGVFRWDLSDDVIRIGDAMGYVEAPNVASGRVSWAIRDGMSGRLFVHERNFAQPIEIASGDVWWPVLGETQLFYVRAGALVRYDLASKEIEELHPGPCGPPAADGDRVVAACGGEERWPAPGKFIAYWDGVQTHQLFEDGGYHFAPRLDAGRIAWIRYSSIDVVCTPPRDRPAGDVRWWDPDVSAEPRVLGEVTAPCLCCDALWPAASLALEGEVLAWNYAIEGAVDASAIGWALIQRREGCL